MRHLLIRTARLAAMLLIAGFPALAQTSSADTIHIRVSGVVFDSVTSKPLAKAVVQLAAVGNVGSARSVITDSSGRFAFEGVPAGRHLLGFMHPVLDVMALEMPTYMVDVRLPRPLEVNLATPAPARLLNAWCGARAPGDSSGVLVGRLVEAESSTVVAGGTVSAQWMQIAITGEGLTRSNPAVHAVTRDDGFFAMCGVPRGSEVLVHGLRDTDSTGDVSVYIPSSGVAYRNLYVAASEMVAVSLARDSSGTMVAGAPLSYRRGRGQLHGHVRTVSGAPLAGARVSIVGSGLVAESDARGEFALRELPLGTRTLVTRAIGYFPDERTIDVLSREDAPLVLQLSTVRSVLDTMRIVGRRTLASVEGFERRRRAAATGHFFDHEQLEKQQLSRITDVLRHTLGVQIVPIGDPMSMGRYAVRVRGGRVCQPDVYLDGQLIRIYDDLREIDGFAKPDEIEAVEVYTAGQAPFEYTRYGSCASLVIWTRR